MRKVKLNGHDVRVDDNGFINANDLHRASGNLKKYKPVLFLRLDSTKELINRLNSKVQICTLTTTHGGATPGTWMHRFLAYEYAGWIDVDFKIGTLNVLDSYFSGNLKIANNEEMYFMLLVQINKSENMGTFHGKGLAKRKQEKQKLHEKVQAVIDEMQPDMFKGIEKEDDKEDKSG